MTLKQTIEAFELLDSAHVTGQSVAAVLIERGLNVMVTPVTGEKGSTDALVIQVPGSAGKSAGGTAPTLGIIGKLGGIGARPEMIGLVSDADGAITAIACALKLADMLANGDQLDGDVVITTHICPNAPVIPHDPVPFMDSPIDNGTLIKQLNRPEMDAILSVDTTRGNLILNQRGFAITPTVKEGYILRVSADLVRTMMIVRGKPAAVLPITTQDITPYGNGIYHINSIMQPAIATDAPVVGVALTAEVAVPGSASGASQATDIEQAARFCIEVAKGFGRGLCTFYDVDEFERLQTLYGSMHHLQSRDTKSK